MSLELMCFSSFSLLASSDRSSKAFFAPSLQLRICSLVGPSSDCFDVPSSLLSLLCIPSLSVIRTGLSRAYLYRHIPSFIPAGSQLTHRPSHGAQYLASW